MSKDLIVEVASKEFSVDGTKVQVLRDLRFSVASRELVALLGPSGCGKTTLLRMILGLDTEFNGNICVGNQVVRAPGLDRCVVFQEPRLIPWKTVRANIEFAVPESRRGESREHISDLISLTGLQGFEKAWPNQLSGGMAQRVALARALVNLPDLLLLDEPFGALDSLTRMAMQKELLRILEREGTTTLMITHDIEEALFLADRILVLSHRPACVRWNISVDIPHPRDRTDHRFGDLRNDLIGKFHV